ncbi:MAG: IS256 family transposase [Terriglobales bacterium]
MSRRYGRGSRQRKRFQRTQRHGLRRTLGRQVRQALGQESPAALDPQVRPTLQLALDRDEVVAWLQESLDLFAIAIGRRVAVGLVQDEVAQLCGPRHQWGRPERKATRYGRQPGYVCVGGQKVGVQRPRVRSTHGQGEVRLQRYEQLQQPDALPQAFLKRMVRGVSTRDYEGVIDLAREGFGVKKSSVSRGFVRASAQRLQAWLRRSLAGGRFVALFLDGVDYAEETLVVALGVTKEGRKLVLGLRQGATENALVVTALLEELVERGLEVTQPTLFVLDGAKALLAGVKRVFGKNAVIQRCQVHKRRNVKAHLAEPHHAELDRRLSAAYGASDFTKARAVLEATVRWLDRISPDAAASLEEGLEETLTVVRLGLPELLRRTLASTNVVESALSVTRTVTARVTRWREGDMRQRWCSAGLQRAEEKFRRVKGYRQIPHLVAALDASQLDAQPRAG